MIKKERKKKNRRYVLPVARVAMLWKTDTS